MLYFNKIFLILVALILWCTNQSFSSQLSSRLNLKNELKALNFNLIFNLEIIGGRLVTPQDFEIKSTVGIIFKELDKNSVITFCSGVLIAPRLVLTAAHCLSGKNQEQIKVLFSADVPTYFDDTQMKSIAHVTIHPKYKDQRNDDIALVFLENEAPSNYEPIPILNIRNNVFKGEEIHLAGFGVIDDATFLNSQNLRKVSVPLFDFFEEYLVTDQRGYRGACLGDSGGPAFVKKEKQEYLVAITRGAHGEYNDCHHFGEFINLTFYQEFIIESALKRISKEELPEFIEASF